MKTALTAARQQVGRRGAFLLFLAMLDFVYAFGLAFPTPRARASATYVFLDGVVGLPFWAGLWAVVGCICLVYAFRLRDGIGYAAALFIKALWALMFLLGWMFADVERGYLSTAIWGAFAAVLRLIATWPEPRDADKAVAW